MSNLGLTEYIMKYNWQTNLDSNDIHIKQCTIPLTAFIDDTN